MLSIEVKVSGELFKAKGSEAIVNDELRAAMDSSTQILRGAIMEKTPIFMGPLSKATTANATGVGRSIEGRVFNSLQPYNMVVEYGRLPNSRGPRSEHLELWVRRTLGVPENKVKSVAFLVARKIHRKGTKAVRMFGRSFEESKGTINRLFDRAAARIVERLS